MKLVVRTNSRVEMASVFSKGGFAMAMMIAAMVPTKSNVRRAPVSRTPTLHVPMGIVFLRDGDAMAT